MKKLTYLFLSFAFVMLAVSPLNSQDWRRSTTKTFAGISGIFFVDQNNGWAVGTSGYIYKSTDAGDNWSVSLSDADSIDYMEVFFVDQNLGFAGGSYGIVKKTTDGGENWTELNANGADDDVLSLYALSENQLWVLANSGSGSKVYYTTDGGGIWQEVLTTASKANAMHFSDGTNGIVGGKTNADLFYTTNGSTWITAATAPLGGFSYTRSDIRGVYMTNAQVGYAVGWGSLIGLQPSIELKTTDGGATWSYLTQAEGNRAYENLYGVYFVDDNNGLAVGGGGRGSVLIKTTDGGTTWAPTSIPCGATLSTITGVGNNVWVCGSGGTILRSTDLGDSWTVLTPIPSESIYDIQCLPNGDIVAAGFDGLFLKSTNSGKDWKASYISVNKVCPNIQDIFFVNDNVGFAAHSYGLLSKTTDGGKNWSAVIPDSIATSYVHYGVFFLNENYGFSVGKFATNVDFIYKTTDGGSSWDLKTSVIVGTLRHIAFANENIGVAVGDKLKSVYTTDGGTTWNASTFDSIPTGDESVSIRKVEFKDENNVTAIGEGIILNSTNGGMNWSFVSAPNLSETLTGLSFKDSLNGWTVGTNSSSPKSIGLYQTTDGGATWNNMADSSLFNPSTDYVYGISINENGAWACGNSSNIFTNASITSVEEEQQLIPESISLYQNYPNPFNPSTRISYNLPQASFVTIKIYDILGREVKTLLNEFKPSGKYEITLNASDLSSGIYFYTLRVGNNIISKKMTLLK